MFIFIFDALNLQSRSIFLILFFIHSNVHIVKSFSRFFITFVDTDAAFSPGYGITVAGGCNGNTSTNQTLLSLTGNILILPNRTLYVATDNGVILAFDRNSRTGRTVSTYSTIAIYAFYNNRTSDLYVSETFFNIVRIFPGNRTIPAIIVYSNSCILNQLNTPTGIVVDSIGNAYIASYSCHWIIKWSSNATTGVRIAGSATGNSGNSSTALINPLTLALDEVKSVIYVADFGNSRIQMFPLDGSGIGVTVAGGNGAGNAPNQLRNPMGIYLSNSRDFIYICDTNNNRVQKWRINGTSGVTVVGSSSGLAGQTPYLLNTPFSVTLDAEEKYIYVSDTYNQRIQRFLAP
jgi:sugar lactone lactonase YvrE